MCAKEVKVKVDAQEVGCGAESLPAPIEREPLEITETCWRALKAMTDERARAAMHTATTPVVLSADAEQSGYTDLVIPA